MKHERGSFRRNRFTSFETRFSKQEEKKKIEEKIQQNIPAGFCGQRAEPVSRVVKKTSRQLLLTGTLEGLATTRHVF